MKDYIKKRAEALAEEYHTRNPFELLETLGIDIEFNTEFTELKGFFTIINGCRFAVINANLPYEEQKIVAAHELGHALLHEEFAKDAQLCDTMLYDMRSKPEFEANLFAAYLLISDSDIEDAANMGYSKSQLAAYLNVSKRLLDIRRQ
ncbi:MAG: ImmA/IrrE family metallo-endopeptidase [Clostridia bacterium]|nr:ImmA/IrrE family metallo-endopeptidase [Clostridia bacterium]